jgi:parvulin-like peptidyl-prolyl isomerase
MKRSKLAPRRSLAAGAALLLAVALSARAEIVERVVVRVNGDIVTQTEFEGRQVAALQAARVPQSGVEQYLRQNNARILQEAVDDLLLVQRAAEMGIRPSSGYIKEVVEGIKKDNNIASDQELQEQLHREGMSVDDLKRNIERSIMKRETMRREVEPKAAVTEADVRAEYEGHKAEYTQAASVHLQEIVVAADKGGLALAQDVVRRARGGEDFEALARAHSSGPTKDKGGDLGRVSRGDLTPEVEKIAFALAAGGVSDPIASGTSYRVLRVTEKTDSHEVPFDEVKVEIGRRLAESRMSSVYETYMEGLRKSALIDLRVREVPLQVTLPATSLIEPLTDPGLRPGTAPPAGAAAPAPGATAPAAREDSEFRTTPQARPERVAPPAAGAPGTPAGAPGSPTTPASPPAPRPSPTPIPR